MQTEVINDWKPETKALLEALQKAGCTLISADNGEEKHTFDGDLDKLIENLTACDEARLYVKSPTKARTCWIYLVYGNSPGELPSNYIVDETLDKVIMAHYEEWELKGQPKQRVTRP